jgi:hypothetical protein
LIEHQGAAEPLVDGVPLTKAFRHREIMLLQAVAEKYGKVSNSAKIMCLGRTPTYFTAEGTM